MRKYILTIIFFCISLVCCQMYQISWAENLVGESSNEIDEEFLDDDLDFLDEEGDEDDDISLISDPFYRLNQATFQVNDKLYFWGLKPVAKAYKFVVPYDVRFVLKNFFDNLGAPVRFVNCLLQGKGRAAGAEFKKFFLNTTIGVLGFGNPGSHFPSLQYDEEDLGQTLATYNIGDGFYIVLPVLGSSTLRDTVGIAGDMAGGMFLNPLPYCIGSDNWKITAGITLLDIINDTSFRLGDYETLKKASIDPYKALRDGYIQRRKSKISK